MVTAEEDDEEGLGGSTPNKVWSKIKRETHKQVLFKKQLNNGSCWLDDVGRIFFKGLVILFIFFYFDKKKKLYCIKAKAINK